MSNWTEQALTSRLRVQGALGTADHTVTPEIAAQHLALLEVVSAVDSGVLTATEAVNAFEDILSRINAAR